MPLKTKIYRLLTGLGMGGKALLGVKTADIEQLRKDLETYRHAFETTAIDRDRVSKELHYLRKATVSQTIAQDSIGEWFREAIDTLDVGSFRFDFRKYGLPANEVLAGQLAEDWRKKFSTGAYRDIVTSFIESTPIRLIPSRTDESLQTIAAYMLASFHAKRGEFDRAAIYAQHIEYQASVDGADLLPYDIQQGSRLTSYRQKQAVSQHIPGAVLVSQVKSASAFLSQAISEVFDIPVLRISLGGARFAVVVRRWADQLADGGAVTHEHFPADPVNLRILSQSKLKKIWVQIRDPRDAAYSLMAMRSKTRMQAGQRLSAGEDTDTLSENSASQFLDDSANWSRWIEHWLHAAECDQYDIDIEFVTYREVTTDLLGLLRKMFPGHLDGLHEQRAIEFVKRIDSGQVGAHNFRKGVGGEWRAAFSQSVGLEAWGRIPDGVKSALELVP